MSDALESGQVSRENGVCFPAEGEGWCEERRMVRGILVILAVGSNPRLILGQRGVWHRLALQRSAAEH